MRTIVAAIAFVALSSPAMAAPTYLSCTFDGKAPIEVTMDEAQSRATVYIPSNGNTFAFAASFGPAEVRFNNQSVSYMISRTTLVIRRDIGLSDDDVGTCQLRKPTKRAF